MAFVENYCPVKFLLIIVYLGASTEELKVWESALSGHGSLTTAGSASSPNKFGKGHICVSCDCHFWTLLAPQPLREGSRQAFSFLTHFLVVVVKELHCQESGQC